MSDQTTDRMTDRTTDRTPDQPSSRRSIQPDEDPVCGMTVDPAKARAAGLVTEHDGREYVFCGRGCLLDFGEDPEKYLSPSYSPSM